MRPTPPLPARRSAPRTAAVEHRSCAAARRPDRERRASRAGRVSGPGLPRGRHGPQSQGSRAPAVARSSGPGSSSPRRTARPTALALRCRRRASSSARQHRPNAADVEDDYTVVGNDVDVDFDDRRLQNDAAMLTLDRGGAPTSRCGSSTTARTRCGHRAPPPASSAGAALRRAVPPPTCSAEADIPIIDRRRCATAYATAPDKFDPDMMICAGRRPARPGRREDTCQGDSGGPLLVPRRRILRAGRHQRPRGAACADPANPASTPASAPAAQHWVHDRTPEADFDFDHGRAPTSR